MDLIPGMNVTSSALDAFKTRLEVISQNLANTQTTRGPDGLPYQRQVVSFEQMLDEAGNSLLQVSEITKDPAPGQIIYNPSHPHADPEGMVRMPNVNISTEMVEMMMASRAYEANLSVAKTSRELAMRALEIGK